VSLANIALKQGDSHLTIAAWAANLLNEQHIYRRSNANSILLNGGYNAILGDYANFNPPRTFGIEATVSF
jgi:iron complex outermembrane receptor protein